MDIINIYLSSCFATMIEWENKSHFRTNNKDFSFQKKICKVCKKIKVLSIKIKNHKRLIDINIFFDLYNF